MWLTADWDHRESDHLQLWMNTSDHTIQILFTLKTKPAFMCALNPCSVSDQVFRWSISPADSSGFKPAAVAARGPLRRSVSEPSTRHLHCPHRLMAEILNDSVFKSYEYEARQSRPIHISLQNILLALWALCCSRRLLLTSIIQPWWAGFPGPN